MATTIRSSMRVKPRLLRMVVLPARQARLTSTMPLRHPIVKAPAFALA